MAVGNQKIHQAGGFRQVELPAASAISPGMLIEEISTGKFQAHSTAGGFGESIVAMEDALQGNTVATDYAANDPVQAAVEQRGSLSLGLLKAGSAYTKGMKLISAGDGTLKPTTGSPSQIFATITVALDLSASGAVNTLSQVRWN